MLLSSRSQFACLQSYCFAPRRALCAATIQERGGGTQTMFTLFFFAYPLSSLSETANRSKTSEHGCQNQMQYSLASRRRTSRLVSPNVFGSTTLSYVTLPQGALRRIPASGVIFLPTNQPASRSVAYFSASPEHHPLSHPPFHRLYIPAPLVPCGVAPLHVMFQFIIF